MKELDKEQKEVLKGVIEHYGTDNQMEMVVEECAELIDAIKKYKRGRMPTTNIIEEMADVYIMLNQLEMILTSYESCEYDGLFDKFIKIKVERVRRRVADMENKKARY